MLGRSTRRAGRGGGCSSFALGTRRCVFDDNSFALGNSSWRVSVNCSTASALLGPGEVVMQLCRRVCAFAP